MYKRLLWLCLFLGLSVGTSLAQNPAPAAKAPDVAAATTTYAEKVPDDPFLAARIPRNSKVYIAPFRSEDKEKPVEGFESYMAAALRKKEAPLIIVNDKSQADFIIEGTADKKAAGLAKKILLGDFHKTTSASITVTNLRTGAVYADSSHRESAARGLRSSAEKLAKYLKKKIEDDKKKAAKK